MSMPAAASAANMPINIPNPNEYQEFEGPLIELAQRSKGDLRKLFTAFFGFLYRRTDFYCIYDNDTEISNKIGFKEGDAEKLLLATFRQYPLRKIKSSSTTTPKNNATNKNNNTPTQVKKEGSGDSGKQQKATSTAPSNDKTTITTESVDSSMKESVPVKVSEPSSLSLEKKKDDNKKTETEKDIRLTEEGLQIPIGNGGITSKYTWTQSLEECTVLIGGLPTGTRGKDLIVSIQPTQLFVKLKEDNTIILDGELTNRIIPDESTWTIEGGVIQIALYKKQKKFWETITIGDDKIDTSLVDSRRNINTYDESTQAQIRKIMFDQQQQAKGLPTSNELSAGISPIIPPILPDGVEYIDKETLEKNTAKTKH